MKEILRIGKSVMKTSFAILLVLIMMLSTASASISPAALEVTLNPGESVVVIKTVDIPLAPLDVFHSYYYSSRFVSFFDIPVSLCSLF